MKAKVVVAMKFFFLPQIYETEGIFAIFWDSFLALTHF